MFVFGMASIGALLGIWIVLSESPVVITVLPLIFAIAGGWGGVSLLKLDFSKPGNQQKLRFIGSSVGALCTACIVSMLASIAARPALISMANPASITYAVENHADPASAIAVRAKLVALGASASEQAAVLASLDRPAPEAKPLLDSLVKHGADYVSTFDEFTPEQKERFSSEGYSGDAVLKSVLDIRSLLNEISAVRDNFPDKDIISLVRARIGVINYFSNGILHEQAIEEIVRVNAPFVEARARLVVALAWMKVGGNSPGSIPEMKQVDEAINALLKTEKAPTDVLWRGLASNTPGRPGGV